jgi:ketosteroid isomerase-like protein
MEAINNIQQRNLELTRRGFEAYNAGDYEGVVALLHPDVELYADDELLNGGSFHGHDGFMQWSAEWLEAWDEFRIEARSIEALGENAILVDTHQIARGAGSGIDVEMDVYWAFEARDGKLRRMHLYAARESALDAIERWRGEDDT